MIVSHTAVLFSLFMSKRHVVSSESYVFLHSQGDDAVTIQDAAGFCVDAGIGMNGDYLF
jgi:hypothetical protein